MEENNGERFQRNVTSIKQAISHIHISGDFSDILFLVDGHFIKGHKLVLSARSLKFARMLLNASTPDIINIEDETITKVGFDGLLQFIYTDILNTDDKSKIIQIYLAAREFEQRELQGKCEELIGSWTIDTNEVCNLFQLGVHLPVLRNRCIQFMTDNGSAVLDSPSFLETSFNSLASMLKCGALDKVPVLKRIVAVMKWFAKRKSSDHQSKSSDDQSKSSDDQSKSSDDQSKSSDDQSKSSDDQSCVDYAEVRNTLQTRSDTPLLSTLHFECLTLEELSEVVDDYDGLITAEENKKFMKYLRHKNPSLLPDWCVVVTPEQ